MAGAFQYGSGRRLATDAQLKLTHDKRAEGITFVDHARTGRENFGDAVVDLLTGRMGTCRIPAGGPAA